MAAGPAFIVGGLSVMSVFFRVGVGLVYLGFALLGLEVLLEPWFKRKPHVIRIVCFACVVGLTVAFSALAVLPTMPIDVVGVAYPGNYSTGTQVDGIIWQPGMSELRVFIANPTEHDYENVDVHIRPDQWTRNVVQVGSAPKVSIITSDPTFAAARMKSSDGGQDIALVKEADSYGFRVLCDRLPAQSRVEILAATSASGYSQSVDGIRVRPFGQAENTQWPERTLVREISFVATYRALLRDRRMAGSQSVRQPVVLPPKIGK